MKTEERAELLALCDKALQLAGVLKIVWPHQTASAEVMLSLRDAVLRLLESQRDAEVWREFLAMAERFPYVGLSHGDGSDSATGWLGWETEIITGIPYGAVIQDGHESAEAAILAAKAEADAVGNSKGRHDK